MMLTLDEVAAAIRADLVPTRVERLGRVENVEVVIAHELLQHTHSFKARGALAAARFSTAQHLVTASSGNFGAALAWAAAQSRRPCTVVMPDRSVPKKIDAVRSQGATVDLIDTTRITRLDRLREVVAATAGAEGISPYDDDRVILGNATLGLDLFAAEPALDVVLVPVGGGGLASGLCVARDRLSLRTRIIGCEPALGNDAARSLAAGRIVANDAEPATICDGARTLSLGVRNFAILSTGLASLLEIDDDAVRAAMAELDLRGIAAEPTGALAFAALQQNAARFAGQRVACVVSGGNR